MNVNKKSNLYMEIDEYTLELMVKKYFVSQSIESYELLAGGLFNTTYKVTIGHIAYVFRIGPVNTQLLLDFEHGMMQAETYLYGLLKEKGIPCQDVIVCDTSHDIINRDYMITRFIDALPLHNEAIPQKDRPEIRISVGHYTRKMHEIRGQQFGKVSLILAGKGCDTWKDYIFDELSRLEKSCKPFGFLSESEWADIYDVFNKHSYVFDEITTPYLNHGDLWGGNLLCAKFDDVYRLVAIIDVDRAVFGDTDYDFASGYMVSEWFIQGYGRELNMSENAILRRKLYTVIFNLIEVYVRGVQYNEPQCCEENKLSAIKTVKELMG
jgi:thiamine kinase-like enzyme